MSEQRIRELEDALRDLLRNGEHDGPCLNFEGQDPKDYDKYDACVLHARHAKERAERAAALLESRWNERVERMSDHDLGEPIGPIGFEVGQKLNVHIQGLADCRVVLTHVETGRRVVGEPGQESLTIPESGTYEISLVRP